MKFFLLKNVFFIYILGTSNSEDVRGGFGKTGLENRPPPPSLHQHRHFYHLEDASLRMGENNDPNINGFAPPLQTVRKR